MVSCVSSPKVCLQVAFTLNSLLIRSVQHGRTAAVTEHTPVSSVLSMARLWKSCVLSCHILFSLGELIFFHASKMVIIYERKETEDAPL